MLARHSISHVFTTRYGRSRAGRLIVMVALLLLAAESVYSAGGNESMAASPPLAVELSFADFFKRPVGPYGLEPSAKLLALDGKRVAITGYMVSEEVQTPGLFILAPLAVALADVEDGPADDLPASVVHVHLQGSDAEARVQHQVTPLHLVGTLAVGNRVEANDRISFVRLFLDARNPQEVQTPAALHTNQSQLTRGLQ